VISYYFKIEEDSGEELVFIGVNAEIINSVLVGLECRKYRYGYLNDTLIVWVLAQNPSEVNSIPSVARYHGFLHEWRRVGRIDGLVEFFGKKSACPSTPDINQAVRSFQERFNRGCKKVIG
jgi:hypothetical protein